MQKKYLIVLILAFVIGGCGIRDGDRGVLYTKDDIYLECIKCDYPEQFTSKIIIIENEEQLDFALDKYVKLKDLPMFEELVKTYKIGDYIYVLQMYETWYEDQKVTCKGIYVDKDNNNISFSYKTKDKHGKYLYGEVDAYITYAIFEKEKLLGTDFSTLEYVEYPGK